MRGPKIFGNNDDKEKYMTPEEMKLASECSHKCATTTKRRMEKMVRTGCVWNREKIKGTSEN
jgi:hypothetical protein